MFVPKKESVVLGPMNDTQKPAFEYRYPYFHSETDRDWAARNRLNINRLKFSKRYPGSIEYVGGFVHTMNALMPPETHFEKHPEYYALLDGKREPTQPCLTNPEVLRIMKARVLELAESTAGQPAIISISQNDNVRSCRCPKCLAMDKEEGSPAGTLLRFVNDIADAVAEKYPNVMIDTLAYQYTEKIPRITRPRKNVIIRLCHMAPSCEIHPLGKCYWNKGYIKNLEAWYKVANKLYVWDYMVDFAHYQQPFPNLEAIVSDIPFHAKHGVVGTFQQGQPSVGGDVADLKAWVISKLLWNPKADPKPLISEFIKGYYGPAAPAMQEYIDMQWERAHVTRTEVHLYSPPEAGHLDADYLEKMGAVFDKAMKQAEGDERATRHVRYARLAYSYVQVAAPDLFNKPGKPRFRDTHDMIALLDTFTKELADLNVGELRESETADKTLAKFRESIMKEQERKKN